MATLWLNSYVAAAALVLSLVSASPFESANLPWSWKYSHVADPATRLTLHVSIKQQNVNYFEQLVLQLSTPDHPSYGHHLENHEVKKILRPSDTALSSVSNWLQDCGVSIIEEDDDIVTFVTTVGNANKMLGTEFGWYKHIDDTNALPTLLLRTMHYDVPDYVAPHIDFVQPTTKFGSMRPMASTIFSSTKGEAANEALMQIEAWHTSNANSLQAVAPPDKVCREAIIPQCLFKLYDIHYGANSHNGNKIAVASFLGQYARYEDFGLFTNSIAQWASGRNFSVIEFNGGLNDQSSFNDSSEANLDTQYVTSVAYPVPVTEFSTGGFGPQIPDEAEPNATGDNEPYLAFLKGIMKLSRDELPQVLSVSYADDEQTLPVPFAQKVCNMFMQLGARGVSVIFASGDHGVGEICRDNQNTTTKFIPMFPASCPWVTAVGGVTGSPTEQALHFSGGGFSDIFKRHSYQDAAITPYLAHLGDRFSPYYNHTGRAFPDVSAQGDVFFIWDSGSPTLVSGTSASSPAFASVIALLNSARIDAGLSTLGFLNPFLYGKGLAGLTDVTRGYAEGCVEQFPNGAKFQAIPGWDLATGLGSPNFGVLLNISTPSACNIGGPLPNPSITSCK